MDAFEHLLKAGDFTLKMPDACWGDPVGADLAIAGRGFPVGFDEILPQHALEGGVERAFLNLQQIIGTLLDVLDKRVTVHRLPLQGLEDHHLQRPSKKIALLGFLGRHHRPISNKPSLK
jgi:hypothetical protein